MQALLDALGRVSDEKGVQDSAGKVRSQIKTLLAESDKLMVKGQQKDAMLRLNDAYLAVKNALESLRDGDTLVRSLHFKNKEEEYLYELDRNNTHLMLVKVLTKGKARKPSMEKMIQRFLEQAKTIRAEAEQTADQGDFNLAIELMEKSTKQIVRAIRSAGVYIPG